MGSVRCLGTTTGRLTWQVTVNQAAISRARRSSTQPDGCGSEWILRQRSNRPPNQLVQNTGAISSRLKKTRPASSHECGATVKWCVTAAASRACRCSDDEQ